MIAMWGHYVTLHMLQLCCKLGYYGVPVSHKVDRDELECFHNSPESRDWQLARRGHVRRESRPRGNNLQILCWHWKSGKSELNILRLISQNQVNWRGYKRKCKIERKYTDVCDTLSMMSSYWARSPVKVCDSDSSSPWILSLGAVTLIDVNIKWQQSSPTRQSVKFRIPFRNSKSCTASIRSAFKGGRKE